MINYAKKNNLVVIDEYYKTFKNKYKTTGKSWYENKQFKKRISWKSKLQFDIDRTINHKDKERFTRAKTIGDDYTEERLKKRINENTNHRNYATKKRIGNIIDTQHNEKAKSRKDYEYWATKHNLQVASIRENGIKTLAQFDNFIKDSADKRQELQDKIKFIDKENFKVILYYGVHTYYKIISTNLCRI